MVPHNPLDIYHSYSYHFIILAAASTEAIRNIVSDTEGGFLANVQGAALGQEIKSKSGKHDSGCFLILDTRKTSEFTVSSLNYDIYIANGSLPSDSVTLMTAMQLHVIDPSGVGFFNYFKYLVDQKFECDITGITFLIHTMFIGHTDDGKTIPLPEYNLSVPCMMGETFNMNEFGPKGSSYDVNFYPVNLGGMGFMSAYNQLFELVPIKAQDNLLGNIVQSFENELNRRSASWYNYFNPSAKDEENNDAKNHKGRLVQYMITIPKTWFYYEVDGVSDNSIEMHWKEYLAEKTTEAVQLQQQSQEVATAAGASTTYHSINVDMTIEDGLASIFKSCPKVAELASKDRKNDGNVKLFKTLTSLTSDDEVVIVHFDVVEFYLPNVDKVHQLQESSNNVDNHPNRKNNSMGVTLDNSMIFEYVFSGLDNDVLDFQIKANNLYIGLMSNSRVAQLAAKQITDDDQTKKSENNVDIIDKTPYGVVKKNQPLVPPPKSIQAFNDYMKVPNKMDPEAKKKLEDLQEFHKTLSDLHVSSLQTSIKIRGNPRILKRYSIGEIPVHYRPTGKLRDYVNLFVDNQGADLAKATGWEYKGLSEAKAASGANITEAHIRHREFVDRICKKVDSDIKSLDNAASNNDKSTPNASFIAAGTWAKVNIYGPKEYPFAGATDTGGNLQMGVHGTNAFRTQLFYDSWYLVAKVSNSFDNGNYTQTMDLLGFDMYGDFGRASKTSSENKGTTK